MTQSSGGTVKAPRLRRLSDQTALMVKGTSPELWMVLSFKDSINWLRNVLYGDMLYYRILWGNAIQEIWCPVVRWNWLGATLEAPLRPNCAFPPSPLTGEGFCHQCVCRPQPHGDKRNFLFPVEHGSADSFATLFSSILLCVCRTGWPLSRVCQGYADMITLAK